MHHVYGADRVPTPILLMRRQTHPPSSSSSPPQPWRDLLPPVPPTPDDRAPTPDDCAPTPDAAPSMQARLAAMATRLAESERAHTEELARLRRTNAALLARAVASERERNDAARSALRYKTAARRMKDKIKGLRGQLEQERERSESTADLLMEKTKSLLERLYAADIRRRDLEARFGTLSRPSTQLRAKQANLNNPAARRRDLVEAAAQRSGGSGSGSGGDGSGGTGGSEGGAGSFRPVPLHGNIPPGIIVDPKHLHDGHFEPRQPPPRRLEKRMLKPSPRKPLPQRVVCLPQKFVVEHICRPLLSQEEHTLLLSLQDDNV